MEINIDPQKIMGRTNNFWNCIHFHPTDAIEDEWGSKLIDEYADSGCAHFIRVYTMFEDIVKRNDDGALIYDYSLNDLRLEHLIKKGYSILICANFMPDCIAKNQALDSGLPRYKGKRVNNSVPADYKDWEEICYNYIMHILDRFGLETVSKWYFHCWNEPDHEYWVNKNDCFYYDDNMLTDKLTEYVKLYDAFQKAFLRANKSLKIGGPSAAYSMRFFEGFISAAKEKNFKLDFVSLHAYSDLEYPGMKKDNEVCPENIIKRLKSLRAVLIKYGFSDKKIIMDEWGAAAGGFLSIKKNPLMVIRENEYLPAFYFKLISCIIKEKIKMEAMLFCLAGQHKSKFDFDGYRSMFTKSGFRKPIYNGFILASLLYENIVYSDGENLIITSDLHGSYSLAMFNLSNKPLEVCADKEIKINMEIFGKFIKRKYLIDKNHSNSYGKWRDMGERENISEEEQKIIYDSGCLYCEESMVDLRDGFSMTQRLTGNSLCFIELLGGDIDDRS